MTINSQLAKIFRLRGLLSYLLVSIEKDGKFFVIIVIREAFVDNPVLHRIFIYSEVLCREVYLRHFRHCGNDSKCLIFYNPTDLIINIFKQIFQPLQKCQRISGPVLRIHDILGWIRIRLH